MDKSMDHRAICVLGMHRSGTSVVTRVLNLIGMELGSNLMPPAGDNPEGFWENLNFVDINEKFLSHLGASWEKITPMFLEEESWSEQGFFPFKDKIKDAIKSEFSNTPLWGWKDPRTCLTFPLWYRALKNLNIQVQAVIIWRNPISVAKSLAERNGFTFSKGYRLWYAYTLSAIYHTRYLNRVIINYDSLLEDWQSEMSRVAKALSLTLPYNEPDFIRAVESFICRKLRHSFVTYEETIQKLPMYVAKLYTSLVRTDGTEDNISFRMNIESSYSQYSSLEQSTQSIHNFDLVKLQNDFLILSKDRAIAQEIMDSQAQRIEQYRRDYELLQKDRAKAQEIMDNQAQRIEQCQRDYELLQKDRAKAQEIMDSQAQQLEQCLRDNELLQNHKEKRRSLLRLNASKLISRNLWKEK